MYNFCASFYVYLPQTFDFNIFNAPFISIKLITWGASISFSRSDWYRVRVYITYGLQPRDPGIRYL